MDNREKFLKQSDKFSPDKTILKRISSSVSKLNDVSITPGDLGKKENDPEELHRDTKKRTFSSSRLDYRKNEVKLESLKRRPAKQPPVRNCEGMHQTKDPSTSPNPLPLTRNIKPLSFSQLITLVEKSSNELLLAILDKKSGILSLLSERNIREDLLTYMFIALGKACSSDMQKSMNDLIKTVWCNNKSFLIHIQQYLGALQKREKLEKHHADSTFYIVVFLEKFQHTMPSSASDSVSILIPLLRFVTERCLKNHEEVYRTVLEKLKELDEENQRFLEHRSSHEMEKESKNEKLHMQEPPENFRCLPVLPTMDDINLPCTFLRPNIVKGKYANTEHYLDVQFRLLREDYIMPLRDGVAEYLNLKKLGKSFRSCKNVRVYSNSRIIREDFVNGELLHLLQFPVKNFSKIKWERTKRFLTGSLLCLSSDDFQSILLATVADRDTNKLRKGLLCIHFEELTEGVTNFNQATNFVVLEITVAYFQAYCHNLKALHQLSEDMLPFKSYIINVEKTIQNPEYLDPTTAYDMRPLLIPLDKKYIKFGMEKEYDYPSSIANIAQSVEVLNEDSWPSASDLNLDNSQYLALKAAVTKELAIIQGPPGTGKTFIGLRIVQLLLNNLNKWFSFRRNPLPILVVCYTNHALDQFLEGLLLFTKQIARIGGRSSNAALSEYQLKNLKRSYNWNWEIRRYIASNKRKKTKELEDLSEEINYVKNCIENSSKVVFSELELKKYIPYFHYVSLKMGYSKQPFGQYYDLTIYDWLNICSTTAEHVKMQLLRKSNDFSDSLPSDVLTSEPNEEFGSEDEADIEYIENQRDIDYYDFNNGLFNRSSKTHAEFNENENSNWQNQSNKEHYKEMIKYITKWLCDSEIMKERDAMKVKNVWNLDYVRRWQLYKFWFQKFVEEKKKELINLLEKRKDVSEEIREIRHEEDFYLLRDCDVVGMTTTGAAKYKYIVQKLNPAILIVEEAAELLESHIITSLAPGTKHMILIGDHQQLRPSTAVHLLSVKYDMDVSLFERMVKNGVDFCTLTVQHRMRPEISALIVPHIYPNLENHLSVMNVEDIKGVKKNVFFVSHTFHELQESDSKSKVNEHEAKFLIKLCRYLILQGYDPSEITVLTTYSGQFSTLKNLTTDENVRKVRFTVVDNFQGEENNIILISFVRSNEKGEIGFLKAPNRVCVALSRAKKGLYCIGNFELLAKKSKLWKNIVHTLRKKESIGKSLQLVCQNHPNVYNEVSTEADFEAVSNGGCSEQCDYRLSCGHCCPLICHPYNHEYIECTKPCIKSCEEGHPCEKKCYELCGLCPVPVDKTLKSCGHTMTVPCGKNESEVLCTFECEKVLSCTHHCTRKCGWPCVENCKQPCLKSCEGGHPCKKKCFEPCGGCDELVDKKLLRCGHTVTAPCGMKKDEIICDFECKKILPCTHQCVNRCGETCVENCELPCIKTCYKDHPCQKLCFEKCGSCTFLVKKLLKKCGHEVKAHCGKDEEEILCYFECKEMLQCSHKCTNKCGEPCVKTCRQMKGIISPICGHLLNVECHFADDSEALFKKCSEELFQKCLEPCKAVLPCGHICKGTCGSCYQGRLHIACNEICERILVCGHKCNSKCARSCPPCSKPCENSCSHKKCLRKCSDPCIKCTEPCEWSCKHKQCTRLCSEICNREACDEPCSLVLPCSHPCLGFCGEPCPDKCEICDDKNNAPTDTEDKDCLRYVLLEDCSHAIQLPHLSNLMAIKSKIEKGLKLKTCPLCNIVIRKNFRYGYVIKSSLFLLENVKKIINWDKERNMKLQKSLYRDIRNSALKSKLFYKSLLNVTSQKKIRNIQELTNIENVYNIISDFEFLKISKPISDFVFKHPVLPYLLDLVHVTCLWLDNFLQKHCTGMSESQLLQIAFEILRLRLTDKLLRYAETLDIESYCSSFEVCARRILNYSSFDYKDVKAFILAFRNLTDEYGGNLNDLSQILNFPVLKGMNTSFDSWNQCENGHIFCIVVPFEPYQKSCYLCIKDANDKLPSKSQKTLSTENIRNQQRVSRSVSRHSEDSVMPVPTGKFSRSVRKTGVRKNSTSSNDATSHSRKYGFKF